MKRQLRQWVAIKRAAGGDVARVPGFEQSLRILLLEERYTKHDVGLMFGVSRQRVEQWCKKLRLAPCGHHPIKRIWVDSESRFRPADYEERKRLTSLATGRAQSQTFVRRLARRAFAIERIRALAAQLGRDPSLGEMGRAVFGEHCTQNASAPRLAALWRGRYGDAKHALDELRAAAGVRARARGGAGHLTHRERS